MCTNDDTMLSLRLLSLCYGLGCINGHMDAHSHHCTTNVALDFGELDEVLPGDICQYAMV
jgi:hypothetical protein